MEAMDVPQISRSGRVLKKSAKVKEMEDFDINEIDLQGKARKKVRMDDSDEFDDKRVAPIKIPKISLNIPSTNKKKVEMQHSLTKLPFPNQMKSKQDMKRPMYRDSSPDGSKESGRPIIRFSTEDTMDQEETMNKCQHLGDNMNLDTDADWTQKLDNQPIVLNDRMMTDAVQSPHFKSEHSYSLTLNDEMPQLPFEHNIKLEDYDKDMETECFTTVSMASATGDPDFSQVLIKQEPPSPPPVSPPRSHNMSTISSLLTSPSPPLPSASSICLNPQSLLKQPTIVLAAQPSALHVASSSRDHQMLFPKVNIEVEANLSTSGFPLPPTPPSCNFSDSDRSLSPVHGGSSTSHNPSSSPALLSSSHSSSSSTSTQSTGHAVGPKSHAKVVLYVTASKHSNSQAALISSQRKRATGVLILTDEEKRTLVAEGYPIPQRLPLTKAEERSLKKIRRKIKNKISAQESRRKKKEHMDALEKKVELLSSENSEYKKKLDSTEGSNRSLLSQLQHLEAILNEVPNKRSRNAATQTLPTISSTISIKSESSQSEMS